MYEEHNRKTGLKMNFIRRLSCCVVLFATGAQYATGRIKSKYLLGGQSGVECQRCKNRGTIAGALYRRSAVARALAAIVLFVSTLLAQLFAQDAALLRHFDYDQKAPLEVQEAGVEPRGDVNIQDISYASPKGGRVPAYLVVPKGKGPFAAVIWGHWYQDGSPFLNRKECLDEAVAVAASGVVSLLTDGPIARPGFMRDPDPLGDAQINDRVQQILDMRRGADLLLARSDVDPKRLAYVGHSYNAATGAFLAGIDKRFKAFVLMGRNLFDEVDMKAKRWQQFRETVGPEDGEAFVNK